MAKNKINFSLIAFFLLSFFVFLSIIFVLPSKTSAFPNKELVYKGRLADSSGNLVNDGSYGITFSIYSQTSGGNSLWSESQNVQIKRGIFSATLGASNPVTIDFNDGNYYLGIKVGSDNEMSPRQQIGAAPFALNSLKLDGSEAGTDANKILKLGSNGEINIAGKITTSNDLQAGSSTLSALTVENDTNLKGKLALSGDANFSGALTVSGNVVAPNIVNSVKGTSGRIYSSGGQNPTIDIDSGYSGQTSITTLGTITSGTWSGSAISDSYIAALGGANQGDIIYRGATGWTKLAAGTAGQYLKTAGAGANPSWNGISGSVPSGTVNNSTLRWDNGGSTWAEDTNFLVTSAGAVSSGTWNGNPIDISGYTNLSVSSPITLTIDTIGLSYNTTNLQLSLGALNTIQNIASISSPTFAGLQLNGSLNFSGAASDITTASGEDLTFSPGGAGRVVAANNTIVQGTLGIRDASTSYYTTFQGGTQIANLTYTLPSGYPGVSGYVLSSTTAGVMSWVAQSGGANYWTANGNDIYKNNSGNVGIGTTNPGTLLQLGTPTSTAGVLSMAGSGSGLVMLQTAAAAGTWTMTLPTSAGTGGYVLSTDGNGVTSWIAQSAGTSYWTDGGTYLYPTNRESARVYDAGGTDYIDIAHDGTDATISFANTAALNINIGTIDLSAQTVDVTLNNAVDALNFDSNTLSVDASNNRIGIGTTAPSTLLQLGTPTSTAGVLSMAGSGSGLVTLQTAAAAGTWTMTLPASAGINGYVLQTDGNGITSWVTPSAGTNYWGRNAGSGYLFPATISDKVGINTVSPAQRLEVLDASNPQLRLTYTAGSVYGDFKVDSSGYLGIYPTGQILRFVTSTAYNDYLQVSTTNNTGLYNFTTYNDGSATGNIGFYSTTPRRHVDITDATNPQIRLTQTDNSVYTDFQTDSSGYLGIRPSGQILRFVTSTESNDYLQMSTTNNTGLYNFTTYNDGSATGNIGFYSTTPRRHVDITDAANPQLRLTQADNTVYADVQTDTSGYLLFRPTGSTLRVHVGNDNDFFQATVNGSGKTKLSSFHDDVENGAIGIFTSDPDRRLDVLDGTNPQLRLTYTDGTVYTDMQTTSSGYFYINPSGARVGIGTSSPSAMLSVGASSQFQVDSSGNIIKINNITYSWPSSQGAASSYLKNDGAGNLSWGDNPVTNQKLGTVSNLRAWQSTNARVVVKADSAELWNSTTSRSWEAWDVNRTIDLTVSGLDGLDTGVEAINTWYYIWLIGDGANVRGLFSTSSTAPTMPGGYTFKKLVGAARNDNSSNILKFMQNGNRYSYYTGFTNGILSLGLAVAWTTVDIATYVPLAISNIVTVGAEAATNGPGDGTGYANISGDGANTVTRVYAKRQASSWSDTQTVDVPITDGQTTIYYRNDVSPANINLTMWVTGFYLNY